ncbi:MAG: hypothetical protein E7391_06010 [Ruminococcaceae bacterium]|nr:hypothetical protein [Oscillospiraceae bacterium]
MKNFKKVLSLVLALALVLTAFVACGKKEDKKGKDDSDAEKAVQKVAEEYFDCIKEMDFDAAAELCTEEFAKEKPQGDIRDMFKVSEFKSVIGNAAKYIDDDEAEKMLGRIIEAIEDKTKNAEFDIKEVEVDEDTATITYEVEAFDMESIDMDEIVEEVKGNYADELDTDYVIKEFLNERNVDMTVEEFNELSKTNQDALDDFNGWFEDYMSEVIPEMFDDLTSEMKAAIGKCKNKVETKTMELELADDEWKIAEIK